MNEATRLAKNQQIRRSLLETKARRANQLCKVYELKLQTNKLSKVQLEALKMMFVEAKWLYNDILNWANPTEEHTPWNYKIGKTVKHLDKDGNQVEYEFQYLGSQMRQTIHSNLNASIKNPSNSKETWT